MSDILRLWSIQPIEVWDILSNKGVFICNPKKSTLLYEDKKFQLAYKWLIAEMEKRIGKRPENVLSPIWAWYLRDWKNKKPDLRESGYGERGRKSVCLYLELPKDRVVLSDFNAWHYVLNRMYNEDSKTEAEWKKIMEWYDNLPYNIREDLMYKSWQNIFDITPYKTEWRSNGAYVQATFWELFLSDVKDIQFFICK